mgnify:CR=1 FL=1|jgi:hypothetical protein
MTFRAVIRSPRKILYSLEEIVDYFDKQRNNVISEYNIGKSKNDKLPLESPFKNKNGRPTKEVLLMAKKWRSRYFNYLMLGEDSNKLLSSPRKKTKLSGRTKITESRK